MERIDARASHVSSQVTIPGALPGEVRQRVLSPEAVELAVDLERKFGARRRELIAFRAELQAELDEGRVLGYPAAYSPARATEWSVAEAPSDLRRRHVEITGPCQPKMMINALNSGADVFMADMEDSLSPTWENVLGGHAALAGAARGALELEAANGKHYKMRPNGATLMFRPRGFHLEEKHFLVDGAAVSASLFDFALFMVHCAPSLIARGSGPYIYLPKLESYLEARLWNEIFVHAQERLGIARGTIRATVLIETIQAAYEMEAILYEIREHASGLNAGRWDYLFSILKKFSATLEAPFPDRSQLTMDLPFLRSYCELLVQVCHRHGAHAIGGMAAFIPSRKDLAVNEQAFAAVRRDKIRELEIGFDGTWVAHPDLVPLARELFAERLGYEPHQKQIVPTAAIAPERLMPTELSGEVTLSGVRTNVRVALEYVANWLDGQGAVAINNLMEDAATAEISRAQLWQWVKLKAATREGHRVDAAMIRALAAEETGALAATRSVTPRRLAEARALLEGLVLGKKFTEFLTLPAYELLLQPATEKHITVPNASARNEIQH